MLDERQPNREDWDRFVIEKNGSFLQSWEWGEFQKSAGRRTHYLKNQDWQALIIRHRLPLGKSYLYIPRGPVISNIKDQISDPQFKAQGFLEEIRKLAKEEKAIFVRIEPIFEVSRGELKELGFVGAKDIQPSKTLILSLDKSEEELLAQMHEKTRYNIGLAQRKEISVKRMEYNEEDFEKFWKLINETSQRQKIAIFPKEYYKKQLEINSENFKNFLFIAECQGRAIAANLLNLFGQTATYLHGGSDNEHRTLMAPHLLQWEQIKYAKSQGCKIYDFWGIDEQKWPGITRFKRGFGGKEIQYCGTWDFVFQPVWYKIYCFARRVL